MASIVKSTQFVKIVRPSQPDDADITQFLLKDVNLFYSVSDPTITSSGNEVLLTGRDAINNMIDNLFLTIPGEHDYEPTFGSRIPSLLWQPIDATTAWQMATASYQALGNWLSEYLTVIARQSSVTPMSDAQGYAVVMAYYEKITNTQQAYSANLYRPG